MDNPYSQPTAQVAQDADGERMPHRLGMLFWLVAGGAVFFSILFGMAGLLIVPAFEPVFQSFGADLTWGTDLVLATSHWWWLLTAAAVALLVYSIRGQKRMHYRSRLLLAFAMLGVGATVAIALAWIALYAPIFALGNQV